MPPSPLLAPAVTIATHRPPLAARPLSLAVTSAIQATRHCSPSPPPTGHCCSFLVAGPKKITQSTSQGQPPPSLPVTWVPYHRPPSPRKPKHRLLPSLSHATVQPLPHHCHGRHPIPSSRDRSPPPLPIPSPSPMLAAIHQPSPLCHARLCPSSSSHHRPMPVAPSFLLLSMPESISPPPSSFSSLLSASTTQVTKLSSLSSPIALVTTHFLQAMAMPEISLSTVLVTGLHPYRATSSSPSSPHHGLPSLLD